jgi:hypothetical protein
MHSTIGIKVLLSAGLAVCAAAWAADDVTPLNVKPGYWETTRTTARSGQLPVPPELLAKMTPEQRARIEERMKASAAEGPQTRVTKNCLTKETLAKAFGLSDNPSCKRTIVTSSPSRQEFQLECTSAQTTSSGTVQVEAPDSEHANGKTKMSVTRGGQTMTMESTFSSKWLGAECPAIPVSPAPPANKQP